MSKLKCDCPACEIAALRARVEELEGALAVCDRVLHFDLRHMIEWGKDYNQAVKDAADVARAAKTIKTI